MVIFTKFLVLIFLSMTPYSTQSNSTEDSSSKPLPLREARLDSYLSAYMDSKYQNTNAQVVLSTPVEDSNSEYGPPDNGQNEISDSSETDNGGTSGTPEIPSTNYGVPDLNFTYRIPHQQSSSHPQQPREPVTQKPLTHYGPPKFYYSTPLRPVYGLPPAQYGPPMAEVSRMPMMLHNLEGFANEFFSSSSNIKLVIAAGMKVLLKLLVFKFIVKFFTMIGLLLLIPKFDMGTMMMMDDGKNKSRTLISDETLDEFTKFVEESYEALRSGGSIFPSCNNEGETKNSNMKILCDLKESAKSLNETFSFSKLFPTYLVQYLEQFQKAES